MVAVWSDEESTDSDYEDMTVNHVALSASIIGTDSENDSDSEITPEECKESLQDAYDSLYEK